VPNNPRDDRGDPPDDPNTLRIPFVFVPHGNPLPLAWIAEHPDYFSVPATMVPHGTRPPPPRGDGCGDPLETAPPPAQAPADRWGRPMCPLSDYPPGERAPGEGGAPGGPTSVSVEEAAAAYLRMEAVFGNPAGDRTGTDSDTTQMPAPGVASRYPGAYDVAEAGKAVVVSPGQPAPVSDQKPPTVPELRGKASFYNPQRGSDRALPGGFDPDVYGAAMYGRPGFRLGDVVRVQLQDDPTRFVDVHVNDTGPFALDALGKLIRPLQPNPDRIIDLTPAAMEALVGPSYASIGIVRVTVTKLPAGSHEGKRENQ
jgi:rare lipoprotein A (peptidoglycan hydrolase)